jgi:hypothetical protein
MKKPIQEEPDPSYYGRVKFHEHKIELWRASWHVTACEARTAWYAKIDGQDEDEFRSTRNDSPSAAIGLAILDRAENLDIAERLWTGIIKKAPREY